MFENTCFKHFQDWTFTLDILRRVEALNRKRKLYIICITPRSGSSYLADLLRSSAIAGMPDEYLNPSLMPGTLAGIADKGVHPQTILEFLEWLIENRRTKNGVFGLKVSYFQYQPFIQTGLDRLLFGPFKHFSLFRRNILKQAISLYVATETNLFHTNIKHTEATLIAAREIPYNRQKIREWITHIHTQECGWNDYFSRSRMPPVFRWDYDQIVSDPKSLICNFASALDLKTLPVVDPERSIFKRVSSVRNNELASEFVLDPENLEFLAKSGIGLERCEGR